MSPTEFDLRSALRDGEGDGLDVDRIVETGRAQRAHRRNLILSTAAAVVVVAAASTGGALLIGNGGGAGSTSAARGSAGSSAGSSAASSVAKGAAAARTGQSRAVGAPSITSSAGASVAAPGASSGGSTFQCPQSLPRLVLPGGGSPGQFGSDGPLFASPVQAVVVCAYGTSVLTPVRASLAPGRLVLTGTDATALAASLENAAKTRPTGACPTIRLATRSALAIFGIRADGTAMKAVTTTLTIPACSVQVSNGTAVRWDWSPPASLRGRLTSLTPRVVTTLPRTQPTGQRQGSPLH